MMEGGRKQDRKKWIWGISLQMILLVILAILYGLVFQQISKKSAAGILCEMLCMMISLFLSASILQNELTKDGKTMLALINTNVVYLFSNSLFFCIDGNPAFWILNGWNNIVYLICPLILTWIFWKLLDLWLESYETEKNSAKWPLLTIAAVQLFLILGNHYGGYYYSIDPVTGVYSRGKLYLLTWIMPLLMLSLCFRRILCCRISLKDKLILLSYPVLPFIVSIIQIHGIGYDYISTGVFLSIVFIYTNYFVKKEVFLSQLELAFEKTRMRSLQMQIKPHFLYNTLTSIAGLCATEPDHAEEMIFRLSDYLRDNFTDIEKPTLITFREELEQLSHYIAIEQMRFPNIVMEWDIQTSDFLIPGMTLQPLVENAINHGIRKRKKSQGTIRISSSETGQEYLVCVKDNGVGFDQNRIPDGTEKHFGLSNVESRLKMLCGGRIKITSKTGEGTEVIVMIPKSREGGQARSRPFSG